MDCVIEVVCPSLPPPRAAGIFHSGTWTDFLLNRDQGRAAFGPAPRRPCRSSGIGRKALLTEPIEQVRGKVAIPDKPGLEIDHDALRHFLVN
jgi:hypothetical protein